MMNTTPAATILSRRFPGKRAFVTGAASGLGRAIATELAAAGWQLGLLDISGPGLARLDAELGAGGARACCYVGDVGDETLLSESVADFVRRSGGLELMVNNAGVAVAAATELTAPADWRWIVSINLLGVAWGCRAAVPHLRAAGTGLVLNVASAAGFAAAPHMSAYNATKAAVVSLSETLAAELQGTGVQVSVAMPGFFSTHLLETMRAPPEELAAARRLMEGSGKDATDAARAILAAAGAGRLHVVWPRRYVAAWRLKRWFPAWFVRRVAQLREVRPPGTGPRPE